MRLLPFLTALLVSVFLYFLIIDRDTLLAVARGESPRATTATAAEGGEDAAAPAAQATQATPATPAAEEAAMQQTPIGVVAVHSQAQVIDSAVILRGETEAARQIDVRSETSGKVISEPLRKGAFVAEGEVLCRLDPGTRAAALAEARARLAEARARLPEAEAQLPRAEAQLESARAQIDSARAQVETAQAQLETAYAQLESARARRSEAEINYNAATRLAAEGYASETRVAATEAALRGAEAAVSQAKADVTRAQAGVAQARAGLATAEANVKSAEAGVKSAQSGLAASDAGIESAAAAVASAEKEISRLEIAAPFEGLLETDTAELGTLLQPGATCATVIQLDPIKLVGFVPEARIEHVAVGAPAGARFATGEELVGRVSFLSRSADPLTRTFRAEVELPNEGLSIRDGQTVEIAIAAEGAPAHLVPQSALTLNDDGTLGVRVVAEDNTARFVPVTPIRDTATGIWIAGLPEKADVIVIGQEYVTDGVKIAASFQASGS